MDSQSNRANSFELLASILTLFFCITVMSACANSSSSRGAGNSDDVDQNSDDANDHSNFSAGAGPLPIDGINLTYANVKGIEKIADATLSSPLVIAPYIDGRKFPAKYDPSEIRLTWNSPDFLGCQHHVAAGDPRLYCDRPALVAFLLSPQSVLAFELVVHTLNRATPDKAFRLNFDPTVLALRDITTATWRKKEVSPNQCNTSALRLQDYLLCVPGNPMSDTYTGFLLKGPTSSVWEKLPDTVLPNMNTSGVDIAVDLKRKRFYSASVSGNRSVISYFSVVDKGSGTLTTCNEADSANTGQIFLYGDFLILVRTHDSQSSSRPDRLLIYSLQTSQWLSSIDLMPFGVAMGSQENWARAVWKVSSQKGWLFVALAFADTLGMAKSAVINLQLSSKGAHQLTVVASGLEGLSTEDRLLINDKGQLVKFDLFKSAMKLSSIASFYENSAWRSVPVPGSCTLTGGDASQVMPTSIVDRIALPEAQGTMARYLPILVRNSLLAGSAPLGLCVLKLEDDPIWMQIPQLPPLLVAEPDRSAYPVSMSYSSVNGLSIDVLLNSSSQSNSVPPLWFQYNLKETSL